MKNFRKSIVFTWLCSYMLILFIPIIISGAMYFQTKSAFEYEVEKSNMYQLHIFKQNMDFILSNIKKLSMEIAADNNIQNILSINKNSDTAENYLMIKASQSIAQFSAINPNIDNIYIYMKNSDAVIGASFITDADTFEDLYGAETGLGKKELQNCFLPAAKNNFISIPIKKNGGNARKMIVYSLPLPAFQSANHTVCLIITMNDSVLFESANGFLIDKKSELSILSSDNKMIASSGSGDQVNDEDFSSLADKEELVYYKHNSERYAMSSTRSEVISWKYVLSVPASILREKAEYIRNLTALGLILCLVIGGIITYYSLVKSYNPLKVVIKTLEEKLKYTFDKNNNEYNYIQLAINKVSDENAKINYKLTQQNKAFRKNVIASLVKGREREVPVHELLSNYDIQFESDNFYVISFYIEDYDSAVFPELDTFAREEIIQVIYTNVVEELVCQKNVGYMAEVDELLVCLVNVRDTEKDHWKADAMQVVTEAEAFISHNYRIYSLSAISTMHIGMKGIPTAFDEAMKAMEYKRIMGKPGIYFFDEINDLPKTEFFFPMEKEYHLINFIKTGNYLDAKSLLEEIFSINFQSGMLSMEMARCLMFDLASAMIKAINELGSINKNDFIEPVDAFKALIECKSINQMKIRIMKTLEQVCAYIESGDKNPDTKIKDKVIEFVGKNYSDVNLGISSIADHIGLTPAYVSKLFKEQMGEGILDYINEVRIRKVKELMKISDDTVENIAKSVGYSNTKTFTRAFKKIEGVTPGKFKG